MAVDNGVLSTEELALLEMSDDRASVAVVAGRVVVNKAVSVALAKLVFDDTDGVNMAVLLVEDNTVPKKDDASEERLASAAICTPWQRPARDAFCANSMPVSK